MYCPACGSHAAEKQKFCRACGMNLDGLTERVASHQGTTSAAQRQLGSFLLGTGVWLALGGCVALVLTILMTIIGATFDLASKSTIDLIAPNCSPGLILTFLGHRVICTTICLAPCLETETPVGPSVSQHRTANRNAAADPNFQCNRTHHAPVRTALARTR